MVASATAEQSENEPTNELVDLGRGGEHHASRPSGRVRNDESGRVAPQSQAPIGRGGDLGARVPGATVGGIRGLDQLHELPQKEDTIRRRSSIDHGRGHVMRLEPEHEICVREYTLCQHGRRMSPKIDAEPSARIDRMLKCGSAAHVERAERSCAGVESVRVSPVERLGQRTSRTVPRADKGNLQRIVRARIGHDRGIIETNVGVSPD